ncbi:alanine racemase [Pseudobacteriovorax antillogorgiicola]|uniref:Predicted amino acid racemase n=1 Tax=Pseudobacteriovorax antillogorgiicola TaxID=1513793 RepID=A0A1Y6BJ73_9BACT|nr:alanine racemase [Pseudobacteriovorax antillogorgiicola]TCS55587.1 putative amino acid racemase [Pseudobacteriovorax antillogorgiicola]SMF10579.1 Predicted amino acid racemase [Pseudobacteriovorax antillogorgiicola]
MALLQMNRAKLRKNYEVLESKFDKAGISWGVVSKLLCGDKLFLKEVLSLKPKQVCDSRVKNLRAIKQLDPEIETVYIKPPAKKSIRNIVQFADISFNTELRTIRMLSEEAQLQCKTHKVVIMIELGDLREGILGEDLIEFYQEVFRLKGIRVIGIGANLNCLNGVMPSQDKLIQLALYKNLIDAKFGQQLQLVSGGSTVTLPLLSKHKFPKSINHFRIGEALYFGINLFTGKTFKGMHGDVFQLRAEIIELTEKPFAPVGVLGANPSGETPEIEPGDFQKTGLRCIIDVGLLDIDPKFMTPCDKGVEILGASSDMIVIELTDDAKPYRVGETINFNLSYMGVLGLMASKYIEKEVIE